MIIIIKQKYNFKIYLKKTKKKTTTFSWYGGYDDYDVSLCSN